MRVFRASLKINRVFAVFEYMYGKPEEPRREKGIVLVLAVILWGMPHFSLSAQNEESGGASFSWSLGFGMGLQRFYNRDYVPGGMEKETLVYQNFQLSPEFSFGKFAFALDLAMNFRFNGGSGEDEFKIRREDWNVGGFQEFLDVYLPKFRYVRYGNREEPFFAQLGSIEGATLGNGFIMSSYTNSLFLPESPVLGMSVNIDGRTVDIPYFGIEGFSSNAARFDIFAARFYVHLLPAFETSILRDLEIGATAAVDRNLEYYARRYAMYYDTVSVPLPSGAAASMYGLDFRAPLIKEASTSFTVFGDWAAQEESFGSMLGFSGRLARILTWEGQIRHTDTDFIPGYFGVSYDLFRLDQYHRYNGDRTDEKEKGYGWFGSLGLLLFDDKFVVTANSSGPLGPREGNYFDWQGILMLQEGLIPHFSFDILYDKKNMADFDDFKAWRRESLIRLRFHYYTEPAVLSLVYILRHIPTVSGPDRQVTAGIEGRIVIY
jgi:hypothetical protein